MSSEEPEAEIVWRGSYTVEVQGNGLKTVFNPSSKAFETENADLILLTSEKCFDHEGLETASSDQTCLLAPEKLSENNFPCQDVEKLETGKSYNILGVEIRVIELENAVAYRLKLETEQLFYTDSTVDSKKLLEFEKELDTVFLPVETSDSFKKSEAVQASVKLKPDRVIPIRFKETVINQNKQLAELKSELEDRSIKCVIKHPES